MLHSSPIRNENPLVQHVQSLRLPLKFPRHPPKLQRWAQTLYEDYLIIMMLSHKLGGLDRIKPLHR